MENCKIISQNKSVGAEIQWKSQNIRTKGDIKIFSDYIQNWAGKPIDKYRNERGIYNGSVSRKSL